jgi:hypothetical protein
MMIGRFLLRFLLVPLGAGIAVAAAVAFVVVVYWNRFTTMVEADPSGEPFIGLALVGAFTLAVLAGAMLLPASLGVLIAEAFAIRSWMFHVLNGGLSAWVGLSTFANPRTEFYADPRVVVAAGIAAGFAYWAVAGWSAGFWKPVFERPPEPPAPP